MLIIWRNVILLSVSSLKRKAGPLAVVKQFIVVFFAVLALGAGPACAQDTAPLEDVRQALAAGDAGALFAQGSEQVALTLPRGSAVYSSNQAVYVVEEFFKAYPPEAVSLRDTAQAGGSWLAEGTYRPANDAPMSLYLRLEQSDGLWVLRELRIKAR